MRKRWLSKKAALMIKDSEANEKLVDMTISLAENKELQKELSDNIAKLAITNADEVIAREILKTLSPDPKGKRYKNIEEVKTELELMNEAIQITVHLKVPFRSRRAKPPL